MKSFIRWSATLGLIGGSVLGSALAGNMQALALPQDQIVKKLDSVPVFTITDPKGAPLVASVNNGDKKGSIAGVFISQHDAQAFIERLKKDNPDLAKNVKVVPVSLGEVYQLAEANKNKPDHLDFAYVPVQQQVDSATALLHQSGQQQQFKGTPLFVARAGKDKDKGYLTVQEGNQQVIPFFFDKEQLQTMVDRYKQQKPSEAATIEIQPVTLEGVIETLKTGNDQKLNNIVLVPSRESLEFLSSLQQQPSKNQSQTQSPQLPAPTK